MRRKIKYQDLSNRIFGQLMEVSAFLEHIKKISTFQKENSH